MPKMIKYTQIREFNARPPRNKRESVILGTLDFIYQGISNRGFLLSILIPILAAFGIVLVSTSLVALLGVSLPTVLLSAGIAGVLSVNRTKEAYEREKKAIQKLKDDTAAFEAEVLGLIQSLKSLQNLREQNSIGQAFCNAKEEQTLEAIMHLLDQIDSEMTRIDKLKMILGPNNVAELDRSLSDKITRRPPAMELSKDPMFVRLGAKLDKASLANESENRHLRRMGYVEPIGYGLMTGFFLGMLALSLAGIAIVSFPWIMIPIAAGLLVGAFIFWRSYSARRGAEKRMSHLMSAQAQVEGSKEYVQEVSQDLQVGIRQEMAEHRERLGRQDSESKVVVLDKRLGDLERENEHLRKLLAQREALNVRDERRAESDRPLIQALQRHHQQFLSAALPASGEDIPLSAGIVARSEISSREEKDGPSAPIEEISHPVEDTSSQSIEGISSHPI